MSPIRHTVLASGSRGNALHLEAGGVRLLVDDGLTARETEARLSGAGLDPARLDAILVTHEHSDHVRGIGVLSRRYHLPVYIAAKAYAALGSQDADWHEVRPLTPGLAFDLGGLRVKPLAVSHDAAEPVGYRFEAEGRAWACVTDLGYAPDSLLAELGDLDLLHVESNHDSKLLKLGSYPGYLKHRIASNRGHLSNRQCADVLARLAGERLTYVILAHLSEENNTPELARKSAEAALAVYPHVNLALARQHEALPSISLV